MPEEYKLPFISIEGEQKLKTVSLDSPGATTTLSDDQEAEPKPKKNKVKYTCPGCKANVWGKPELNLACMDCDCAFEEVG